LDLRYKKHQWWATKAIEYWLGTFAEPTILFVDEPTSGLSSRDFRKHYGLVEGVDLAWEMIFRCDSSALIRYFQNVLMGF